MPKALPEPAAPVPRPQLPGDGQIGVDKEAAPNREGRVGNSNVHGTRGVSLTESRGWAHIQNCPAFLFQHFELGKLQASDFRPIGIDWIRHQGI